MALVFSLIESGRRIGRVDYCSSAGFFLAPTADLRILSFCHATKTTTSSATWLQVAKTF